MPSSDPVVLRTIPFFADLPVGDLEAVLAVGGPVSFQQGEAIVREGDPGDAMYVLLSGSAEVDVGGRFHTLRTGDFFGEMALLTERRRTATVKAAEPVEALRIPAEEFQAFVLTHPSVALAMMRGLVSRLREVQERIDAWIGNG
jgi:CRP/FNR family transcriptional regulator, cyclic AMP receptor protein